MLLVAAFNPISAMSGSFIANTLQVGSKMLIINKSYVDILFTFSNGNTVLVIANDRRGFALNDVLAVGNPTITWKQQNIDYPQTVNQLENVCYVEVYQPSEIITETYPQTIVRETLPSLVPYNIGHGAYTQTDSTAANVGKHLTVFPSSYAGLAIGPTSIGGLGYDHFYLYQNLNLTTLVDLPGQFSGTGKAGNNATPVNEAGMSYVPGPFSLAGLAPIDTATHASGAHWILTTAIPWASSTSGYLVEAWIQLDAVASGVNQPIFGDDGGSTSNQGVTFYIDPSGHPSVIAGFSGAHFALSTLAPIPDKGQWVSVAWQYTGTVTNTFNIFVNGQLAATGTTNGTPVNTTQIPRIGNSFDLGGQLNGSIAYVGVLLSGPGTGQGSPQARFEHAQQSLNTDYQNAWITGFDFDVLTGTATTVPGSVSISNIFNPSGLLYAITPSNSDILHIYNTTPQVLNFQFPAIAANGVFTQTENIIKPLMQFNTIFFGITYSMNSTPTQSPTSVTYRVQGYNILGIA